MSAVREPKVWVYFYGSYMNFDVLREVDLVVPGPEAALVAGIADACAQAGIACFGPSAAAAHLEASKSYAKEVMDAAGVTDGMLTA